MSKKPKAKASKKPAVKKTSPLVMSNEAVAKANAIVRAYRCAGYNEEGIDRYINAAEDKDRGTARFPWPADLKPKIKANLNGLHNEDQMRDTLNKTVLEAVGGGLHSAGPIDGGPYGRGPARALGL